MRKFWIIAIAISLASATPLFAGDYMDKQKRGYVVLEPSENQAVVCVIRKQLMGAAIKFWTFADQEPLGITRGKSHFCALVEAGTHRFWSKAENVSVLDLEVEPGNTYYLKNVVRMGVGKARVKLVEMDTGAGSELVRKLPATNLTDDGRARGREIATKKYDRVVEKENKS